MTRLLIFGILFSTTVNAKVVAKSLILGISVLTSSIFILRIVLVAKLLISGILSLIFFILALSSVFSTTSFLITLLRLLKSTGIGVRPAKFDFNAKLEVSTCEIFLMFV